MENKGKLSNRAGLLRPFDGMALPESRDMVKRGCLRVYLSRGDFDGVDTVDVSIYYGRHKYKEGEDDRDEVGEVLIPADKWDKVKGMDLQTFAKVAYFMRERQRLQWELEKSGSKTILALDAIGF